MNPNKRTKSRRKYDAEFKQEALKMVEAGRSVSEVSQGLGIGENLLYRWRKNQSVKVGKHLAQVPEASSLVHENSRLKAALHRAEQERDILKKALSIFSGAAPADRPNADV